jgi:hypothetical protein
MRVGKVEEEKEEAETRAWNFHIKNSLFMPAPDAIWKETDNSIILAKIFMVQYTSSLKHSLPSSFINQYSLPQYRGC